MIEMRQKHNEHDQDSESRSDNFITKGLKLTN